MLTLVLFWFCSFGLLRPSSSMVHGDVPLDDGPGADRRVSSSYLSEGGESSWWHDTLLRLSTAYQVRAVGFKKLICTSQREAMYPNPCTSLPSCLSTLLKTPSWLTQALMMKWVWHLAEISDCLQHVIDLHLSSVSCFCPFTSCCQDAATGQLQGRAMRSPRRCIPHQQSCLGYPLPCCDPCDTCYCRFFNAICYCRRVGHACPPRRN